MPIISTERYDIDPQPIGKGGFGEAYAARDLLFDREVVIKTIIASRLYGIDEPAFRHQFFREALVSAKLGHESNYIVKVFDYGYDRDTDLPFFVMEKIEGGDLSDRVGRMDIPTALKAMSDVLKGLAVAHKHGVIHSDISPDNILFDPQSKTYKLNDFGLAKLLSSALMSRRASLSLTGGKPGYLPIDQWHTGDRNQFSDLYGLAVSIVELVTGNVPLWGFDFKTGQLTGPDLADLFPTADEDVIVSKVFDNQPEHPFGVAAHSADFDYWRSQGSYYHYWVYVTQADIVSLLSSIIRRELTDSKSVLSFMAQRTLEHIKPIEQTWREEEEAKAETRREEEEAAKKRQEEEERKQQQEELHTQQAAEALMRQQLKEEVRKELQEELHRDVVVTADMDHDSGSEPKSR